MSIHDQRCFWLTCDFCIGAPITDNQLLTKAQAPGLSPLRSPSSWSWTLSQTSRCVDLFTLQKNLVWVRTDSSCCWFYDMIQCGSWLRLRFSLSAGAAVRVLLHRKCKNASLEAAWETNWTHLIWRIRISLFSTDISLNTFCSVDSASKLLLTHELSIFEFNI